eukprot:gene2562-2804_t
MQDWKSPEYIRKLLLSWRDEVKALMPFAHRKERYFLSEADEGVVKVCDGLEALLFHGMRGDQLPFWQLLQRLDLVHPPDFDLHQTLTAIASTPSLQTPLGKARSWVRRAVQTQQVEEALGRLLGQPALVSRFYRPEALLCSQEFSTMLLAIVRSLNALHFSLRTDGAELDLLPPHLLLLLDDMQRLAPNASQPTFLHALEVRLDSFVSKLEGTGGDGRRVSRASPRPFFGSHLRDLVLDESRTPLAHIYPRLGLPRQAQRLIDALAAAADTPDLFRQRASLSQLEDLRRAVEMETSLPAPVDVAAASILLAQWVIQLPEPLLGNGRGHVFLACREIEDEDHRKRNLALLVQETPWYARPLLLRLVDLVVSYCLAPRNTERNRLNLISAAMLVTPWLLRLPSSSSSAAAAAAAGTSPPSATSSLHPPSPPSSTTSELSAATDLVQFMLRHHEAVFGGLVEDLSAQQAQLAGKCSSLQRLLRDLQRPADPDLILAEEEEERIRLNGLLWDLFAALEAPDGHLLVVAPSSVSQTTSSSSKSHGGAGSELEELLSEGRWGRCNVNLSAFKAPPGLLALECLVGFLRKYGEKAARFVCDAATSRRAYCDVAQIASHITFFVADALQLVAACRSIAPSSPIAASAITSSSFSLSSSIDSDEICCASLQRLAKQSGWVLFNNSRAFQELFDLGMLCFDESWRNCSERIGELPVAETCALALQRTRQTLRDLLAQRPKTLEAVWEAWISAKLAAEEALFQTQSSAFRLSQTHHSSLEYLEVDSSLCKQDSVTFPNEERRSRSSTITSKEDVVSVLQTPAAPVNINNFVGDASENDKLNAKLSAAMEATEMAQNWTKTISGVTTTIYGASKILSAKHIEQLESVLPLTYQCCDWKLLYRMSLHGSSVSTLLHRARQHSATLLVIQDSKGAIFGALITESLRMAERDKYYGNGTIGVWSFNSGAIKFYPWSYKNSYFLLSSTSNLALGGGGNFAIFLDTDLNRGSSGQCETFNSPCLASEEEFECHSCEVFALVVSQSAS